MRQQVNKYTILGVYAVVLAALIAVAVAAVAELAAKYGNDPYDDEVSRPFYE